MSAGIRTDRLVLREWRDTDREPWAALNADPEVMRYFPSTYDRQRSDAAFSAISTQLDDRGWGLWAAIVRSTRLVTVPAPCQS